MAVNYIGRAASSLAVGNYLFICKPDGSVAIHGATLHKPLNYQRRGSAVEILRSGAQFKTLCEQFPSYRSGPPQTIIAITNGTESITIAVYREHSRIDLDDWTDGKIALTRSEHELRDLIFVNLDVYLPTVDVVYAMTEVPSVVGVVDILVIDTAAVHHIIEVKRKLAGLAACSQLDRYGTHFTATGKTVKSYLAAPAISSNARAYCQRHDLTFIVADFDDQMH